MVRTEIVGGVLVPAKPSRGAGTTWSRTWRPGPADWPTPTDGRPLYSVQVLWLLVGRRALRMDGRGWIVSASPVTRSGWHSDDLREPPPPGDRGITGDVDG